MKMSKVPSKIYELQCDQPDPIIYKIYSRFSRDIDIRFNNYLQAFRNIKSLTTITKFKDFQYRLLANVIHTNNRLYYWNKVDSKICEFCKLEVQTPLHLLVTCRKTQDIWEKVQVFLTTCTTIAMHELNFQKENLILNSVHPNPGNIVNFIVLITKQFIFACKCRQTPYAFCNLLLKIENLYQSEYYNARYNPNLRIKFR